MTYLLLITLYYLYYITDVVTTLAKNVKTCVLKLSAEKICFILSDHAATGGANLWCELLQENLFDEYRIEGKDDRNEIYLDLTVDLLSRALKSSLNASVLKIKLTKKQGACLTVDIVQVNVVIVQVRCGHCSGKVWSFSGKVWSLFR